MAGIVTDTSVWVAFLAGETIPALDNALAAEAIAFPPLVVAELVSGADRPNEREAIGLFLEEAPLLPTDLGHWIEVGLLRRRLRKKGLNLTIADAHIAQCALERDAVLLSRDRVFERVARLVPLRFTRP